MVKKYKVLFSGLLFEIALSLGSWLTWSSDHGSKIKRCYLAVLCLLSEDRIKQPEKFQSNLNNIRIIIIIISSINAGNMSFSTSLHDVLDNGNYNLEEIKTFLELDSSSVNALDSSGDTPLLRILRNNKCSVDVVKLLLNYGSDVNCRDERGWTTLIIALTHCRNVDFINLLLEKGANINVGGNGYSALHWVIVYLSKSQIEEGFFQLLIERKADVNAVNRFGQSILCSALESGLQASNIKMLLAAGAVLNCTKHTSSLLCATIRGAELRADVVHLLLEHGACVNIDVVQCALMSCINETKAIGLLLDHLRGADAKDVEDELNNTLLHFAASNRYVKQGVVKLLVKQGVGVNRENKTGDTALHEVAKHKHGLSSVIKTLLKSGSRVNVENASGETPLYLAMKQLQDADALKMLFAAGARIGVAGYSILKDAIKESDFYLLIGWNLNGYWRPRRLKCFKMLMKCYSLEKPDFDFQYLIPSDDEYEELMKFGFDCVRELQKLDSNIVGEGRTLREFLWGLSPFQVEAANFGIDAKSILFDQLLKIIAENAFPLFLDIISAKVGRSPMKTKLETLQVYTYLSDESRVGEKVVLNYDTVYKIGNLLTDDDLLRFISAFNKTDIPSCAEKVRKENMHEDKGSDEHCHKRPRLHL